MFESKRLNQLRLTSVLGIAVSYILALPSVLVLTGAAAAADTLDNKFDNSAKKTLPFSTASSLSTNQVDSEPELLKVDQAFQWHVDKVMGRPRVTWTIAPGYYLYKHPFQFVAKVTESNPASEVDVTASTQFSPSLRKHDDYFGPVEVYYHQAAAVIPKANSADTITIRYQGCADAGLCYPVQTRTIPISH